jgi:hypothetical protein
MVDIKEGEGSVLLGDGSVVPASGGTSQFRVGHITSA